MLAPEFSFALIIPDFHNQGPHGALSSSGVLPKPFPLLSGKKTEARVVLAFSFQNLPSPWRGGILMFLEQGSWKPRACFFWLSDEELKIWKAKIYVNRRCALTPGFFPQSPCPAGVGLADSQGALPEAGWLGVVLRRALSPVPHLRGSSPSSLPCPLTSFVGFPSLFPLLSHPSLSESL